VVAYHNSQVEKRITHCGIFPIDQTDGLMMDDVAQGGEPIVITKNGAPVARLVPFRTRPDSLIGLCAETVRSHGDLTEPLDVDWEVLAE